MLGAGALMYTAEDFIMDTAVEQIVYCADAELSVTV